MILDLQKKRYHYFNIDLIRGYSLNVTSVGKSQAFSLTLKSTMYSL
jgi:hypothetical protein